MSHYEHERCEQLIEVWKTRAQEALQLALTFQRKVMPMALTEESYEEYADAKQVLAELQTDIQDWTPKKAQEDFVSAGVDDGNTDDRCPYCGAFRGHAHEPTCEEMSL